MWLHLPFFFAIVAGTFSGEERDEPHAQHRGGAAGMGVRDLVKVTHYLVRKEDIKDYVAVRVRPQRRLTTFEIFETMVRKLPLTVSARCPYIGGIWKILSR